MTERENTVLRDQRVAKPTAVIREELLYSRLCEHLGNPAPARASSGDDAGLSIGSLLPVVHGAPAPPDDVLHGRAANRTMLLDKETGVSTSKAKQVRPRPRWATEGRGVGCRATVSKTSTKRARSSKVNIPAEEQQYDIYEPLSKLWDDYALKVIGDGNMPQAGDRLLRMDLHGARVEITRARDPGLVGVAGILVIESANIVLIVTRKNRLIAVPKDCAFVRIRIGSQSFEIALPMILYRASERSARKVKKKHLALF
jgi:ribonuclease P protein subunit POP4